MISGSVYIQAGDESIFVGESVTYNVSTTTRSSVTGLSGFAGTSEVWHTPFVEFEVIALEKTDIMKLEKLTKIPATLILGNGKKYSFINASKCGDTDWNEKSKGTMRLEAEDCREL